MGKGKSNAQLDLSNNKIDWNWSYFIYEQILL